MQAIHHLPDEVEFQVGVLVMVFQFRVIVAHDTPHVDEYRIGTDILQGLHIDIDIEINGIDLSQVGLDEAEGFFQPPAGLLLHLGTQE